MDDFLTRGMQIREAAIFTAATRIFAASANARSVVKRSAVCQAVSSFRTIAAPAPKALSLPSAT